MNIQLKYNTELTNKQHIFELTINYKKYIISQVVTFGKGFKNVIRNFHNKI